MKAPFPYFGGKSKIAPLVWSRLGDCPNYIEPFFGSGAMLLARPDEHPWSERVETVNDADGLISNFWRAVQHDPDTVAHYADWPINEADLHARHCWLLEQKSGLAERLMGNPAYYDPQVAGWWVWGICSWIGSGWCRGDGPWRVVDGLLVVGNAGLGINRKLPHLGNAGEQLCATWSAHLRNMMERLADRLRRVRVCCGDWSRITTHSVTTKMGLTGVFLDPPYGNVGRLNDLYNHDSLTVADTVRAWCLENGPDPLFRIALCGYAGEHDELTASGWECIAWRAGNSYGNAKTSSNNRRERIWFSPHCLKPQPRLL